jgi:hypothetical protein
MAHAGICNCAGEFKRQQGCKGSIRDGNSNILDAAGSFLTHFEVKPRSVVFNRGRPDLFAGPLPGRVLQVYRGPDMNEQSAVGAPALY